MIFTAPKSAISPAVSKVAKTTPSRSERVSETFLTLTASKETGVRVESSTLAISASMDVEADVTEEGEIKVFGSDLAAVLRSMPDGEVRIKTHRETPSSPREDLLLESCQLDIAFTLEGVEANTMTTTHSINAKGQALRLRVSDLLFLLRRTSFAAGHPDHRPTLAGVAFSLKDDRGLIQAVATDGHRLAVAEVYDEAMELGEQRLPIEEDEIVIPTNLVRYIEGLLEDEERADFARYVKGDFEDSAMVDLVITRTAVLVRCSSWSALSPVASTSFPDWEHIMPAAGGYSTSIDREQFARGLSRCCAVGAIESHCSLIFSPESVLLQARASGRFLEEEIDARLVSKSGAAATGPKQMSMAAAAAYIKDAVNGHSSERVLVRYLNSVSPFVILSDPDPQEDPERDESDPILRRGFDLIMPRRHTGGQS